MKNLVMKYFSKEELTNIGLSIVLISLVFSYPNFSELILISLITTALYYLVKQPAHKIMAKRLQCTSTYKLWSMGVFATIFSIFLKITQLNFSILMPGHIEVLPYRFGRKGIKVVSMTPRDSAMVSLAGLAPVILLSIIFTFLTYGWANTVSNLISFLVLYDLLPIPNSDGGRIFTWHIIGWVALILFTLVIFIV